MKRFFSILVLLVVSSIFIVGAGSQSVWARQTDTSVFDTYIHDMMAMYDVPGAGIAIVQDGEVIYAKGFGVRNTKTGEPVTPNTQFAIGSITKSFTALAIAQLVDAGVLDLDTPVIEYLPDFKLSDPEATRVLTLRHLLSHSSGLTAYSDEFWYQHRPTRQEVIDNMATIELTATPGEKFQYNNQNYTLAGWIIQQVTGQTWEDYVREHIFMPLDMNTANFDINDMQQLPDYASPHRLDILEGMLPIPFFDGLGAVAPAGAINADILEMANYTAFQLGEGAYNGKRIVSAALFTEMHTEQVEGYAMGWVPDHYKRLDIIWHNGAIDGFSSNLLLIPSENIGAVVLANGDGSTAGIFTGVVLKGLLDRALGLPLEPRIEVEANNAAGFDPDQFHARLQAARSYQANPATLQTLVGDYAWSGGQMRAQLHNGTLYLHVIPNGTDIAQQIELVPFADNQFMLNAPGVYFAVLRVEIDDDGSITVFQDNLPIARRVAETSTGTTYTDPAHRFSVELPPDLLPQSLNENLVLILSTEVEGAYVVGTGPATSDQLKDNVRDLIATLDPTFNLEPDSSRQVTINGQTWTEFIYTLPIGQTLVIRAIEQDQQIYVVLVQVNPASLEAAMPLLEHLTASLQILK